MDDNIRFKFGKNWKKFIDKVDVDSLDEAKFSLREILKTNNLEGLTFLDIGSGSGLGCNQFLFQKDYIWEFVERISVLHLLKFCQSQEHYQKV